ncbi:hypothetical protein JHK82_012680 [Glycine max]|nr:hypothetical protein JHK82_012680 [Glycine max]
MFVYMHVQDKVVTENELFEKMKVEAEKCLTQTERIANERLEFESEIYAKATYANDSWLHVNEPKSNCCDWQRIGGLQVRSNKGEWIDINPSEGTLVVNIGDMLQAWNIDHPRARPLSRISALFKHITRGSMA